MSTTGSPGTRLTDTRARNAVAMVFALNGLAFATWMSRIPQARTALDLTPGHLGTLLLALSVGAVVALPSTGWLVHRYGAGAVVATGSVIDATGLAVAAVGVDVIGSVWLTAGGLFLLGFGSGSWDVAMNVEGAAVERALGRNIMSRFHAAFSLGTVGGAGLGALVTWAGGSIVVHLAVVAAIVGVAAPYAARAFLPAGRAEEEPGGEAPRHPLRAWTEPRTLVIGAMVFAMALTEGVANDWLAVALVDGHDVEAWVGAAGFAVFVAAMTVARFVGTTLLDRFGRASMLWACMALAVAGVLLVVLAEHLVVVVIGIVLWGLGAALGFPVGMSAAADEPANAASRVSVVSTIGYTAFLAGPPLLGHLGDRVGVLQALLVLVVLLVPSALAVPAARPPRSTASTPAKVS
jgi:MFS family permease